MDVYAMRAKDCASCCVSEQRVTDDQDFERGCRAEGDGYNRERGRATSTREMRRECDDLRGHAKQTYGTSTVVQVRRTKKMNNAKRGDCSVQGTIREYLRWCVLRRRDGEAASRRVGASATRLRLDRHARTRLRRRRRPRRRPPARRH